MGRRYKCNADGCDKAYTTKPNLLRHIRMLHHMNDPVLALKAKTIRGNTKYSSKELVIGMEDNEFACPFPGCHKYYQFRSRLKTHMRKHKLPSLLDTSLSLPDRDLFKLSDDSTEANDIAIDGNLPRLSPSRKHSSGFLPPFDFSENSKAN
mmetsp:Transcript_13596/g.25666  ORF Transcript_13596/g.25666 Transcript_13596/m.25666 type:complete len:151 (-) Transcript_13596:181-633(-)